MNDASTPPPVDPSQSSSGVPECYRHPGRETYIRCQRCNRLICPDCMRDAAVGFQCPECVARGAKETRSGLGAFGGRRSSDPRTTSIMLVASNLAVWLAVVVTGGANSRLAEWLMLTPLGRCTTSDGSQWYPGVSEPMVCQVMSDATWWAGVSSGGWWQILTHGFVHVDVWHVALNCVGLWILGPAVEQSLGRLRFLAVYLVSIVAAGAAIMWLAGEMSSTLGASGGVFGLMGALVVIASRVGGDVRGLLTLLAINAVVTFTFPGISWQGHVGGFVGGAVACLLIVLSPKGPRRPLWQWLGLAATLVSLVAVIAARILVLT